jgi:pilus assembly protein CpaE
MRAGVRSLPSPVSKTALEAAVARAIEVGTAHCSRSARVLAFESCKGGSDSTFSRLISAISWARGKRCWVIDLNPQLGEGIDCA